MVRSIQRGHLDRLEEEEKAFKCQSHPRKLTHAYQPFMRFLFVRPRLCRRLLSDSTSRWKTLPLANTLRCQACNGLVSPSLCPCWAHKKNCRECIRCSAIPIFPYKSKRDNCPACRRLLIFRQPAFYAFGFFQHRVVQKSKKAIPFLRLSVEFTVILLKILKCYMNGFWINGAMP